MPPEFLTADVADFRRYQALKTQSIWWLIFPLNNLRSLRHLRLNSGSFVGLFYPDRIREIRGKKIRGFGYGFTTLINISAELPKPSEFLTTDYTD